MIKSAHTIYVRFSPVSKNIEAFSDKILSIKGTTLSGGSYSSYPSVTAYTDDFEKAVEIQDRIVRIIGYHGGQIIND